MAQDCGTDRFLPDRFSEAPKVLNHSAEPTQEARVLGNHSYSPTPFGDAKNSCLEIKGCIKVSKDGISLTYINHA